MSPLARVRAMAVAALPTRLRGALRRARTRAQRIESRMRKTLPQTLGGRFERDALVFRVLDDRDLPALHALRPRPGQQTATLLGGPSVLVIGVSLHGKLIASGRCVGVGPSEQAPFDHVLFGADYVAPRYRRRGVARELHLARLREATARGARTAFAWVRDYNGASIASFEAIGFARVAIAEQPAWLQAPAPRHVLLRYRL